MTIATRRIALTAGILLAVALTSRADIVIDNFNQGGADMYVCNTSTTASATSGSLATTNTIGGERRAFLTWEDGSENTTLQINQSGDSVGKASYSSSATDDGLYQLVYGASADLNANLSQGGLYQSFAVHFTFSDIAGYLSFAVVSGGATNTISVANPTGGTMDQWQYYYFANFTGSPNWSDIDRIDVEVNGTMGADIAIDEIKVSTIPEPTTLVLGAIGLAGMLHLRRRMKNRG